jgi:VWFA-related protein
MIKGFCTCVVWFLGVPGFAWCAQADASRATANAPIAAVPQAQRDSAEGLIKLDIEVTDGTGQPVAGLDRADFSLLENGQEQKILSFQEFHGRGAGTEPPVKIILLIDTIELPANLARDERLAVEAYLRKDGGHLSRPVSVFLLSDTGLWTVKKSSSDGNTLVHEIERNDITPVRHNKGWQRGSVPSTEDLKDTASESSLKALAQIATDERMQPGRKLLVWVGPGWGIGSGASADAKGVNAGSQILGTASWFSTLLREAHLVLYSFAVGETGPEGQLYKAYLDGVSSPHKANFMNLYRKVLAVQSGGRVMDDSLDLVKEIDTCVQDDGYFYRISFDPFPADRLNEYHDLKVVVAQPGLTARTNTGYYDQPYYSVDPIPVPRRVSIDQLQKVLEQDESDGDKAKQLSGLELTERLSERRLSLLDGIVHGKRTRQELRILADVSAFLDPPPDEIPNEPPPDADAQQRMLSLASAYLRNTIRKLPDLFASRTMVRYQETPMYLEGGTSINYQPFHVTDNSTTTVRYRNGFEITEAKPPRRKPNNPELITYGVFGPALNGVVDAIDKPGELTWRRWEQGTTGRVAVFRYIVPPGTSLYQVWLCCLPDGDGTESFERFAGYHVEIGIDPDSGAILRFQLQVDLKSTTPMSRSGVLIEYGPVAIGGKSYICPVRSVSIMRSRSVRVLSEWDVAFRTYGPYAAMLNDMTFDRYHIFRSESHMLPDFTPGAK